jgi:hypothetical protein
MSREVPPVVLIVAGVGIEYGTVKRCHLFVWLLRRPCSYSLTREIVC